jgi:hypothetical protein
MPRGSELTVRRSQSSIQRIHLRLLRRAPQPRIPTGLDQMTSQEPLKNQTICSALSEAWMKKREKEKKLRKEFLRMLHGGNRYLVLPVLQPGQSIIP